VPGLVFFRAYQGDVSTGFCLRSRLSSLRSFVAALVFRRVDRARLATFFFYLYTFVCFELYLVFFVFFLDDMRGYSSPG